MHRVILVTAFIVGLAIPASAYQLIAEGEERFSFFYNRSHEQGLADTRATIALRNVELLPQLSFAARGIIRYSSANTAQLDSWNEPANRDERQSLLGLDEFYVNWAPRDDWLRYLRLRVGKQDVDWGVMDRVRPSDLVTPRDYTDLSFEQRITQWTTNLRLSDKKGNLVTELVWLPFFSPTRFARKGPWQLIPDGIPTHDVLPEEDDLTSSQFGLRTCYRYGEFRGCAFGYHGRDQVPFTQATPVGLRLDYAAMDAAGGDAAYSLGPYLVRVEGAYRDYRQASRGFAEVAGGIERIWSNVDRWENNLFAVVQYIRRLPERRDPFFVRSVFTDAIIGRISYGRDADGFVQLEGAGNLDPVGYLVEAKVASPLWHGLQAEAIVGFIGGNHDHLFGARFDDNDRVMLRVTYKNRWSK